MPDEDHLSLRQADQTRSDFYGLQDDLDFTKVQLAHLPTRNEVWRAAMLGILGGAVAAVTLIEGFARSCLCRVTAFAVLACCIALRLAFGMRVGIPGALIQHWLCYRRYPESRCITLFSARIPDN